jgi:hypothetical protein
MNESKSESLQRTHAVMSTAVHALLEQGLNPREAAAVLVTSAHALLECDDPHQAKGLLLLLAGRITGTAQEVRRND